MSHLGAPSTELAERCEPAGAVPTATADRASVDSASCDHDCTAARCGDGYANLNAGEQRDPVFHTNADPGQDSVNCDNDCTLPVCGDGHVNAAANEQCEPPNTAKCEAACKSK
ncbi:MAG TPA: hypothetical protein VFK05_25450 [Polyangiaceae bacterium]|nr:hypothetical protein [Polyangiaceae bacterium]